MARTTTDLLRCDLLIELQTLLVLLVREAMLAV